MNDGQPFSNPNNGGSSTSEELNSQIGEPDRNDRGASIVFVSVAIVVVLAIMVAAVWQVTRFNEKEKTSASKVFEAGGAVNGFGTCEEAEQIFRNNALEAVRVNQDDWFWGRGKWPLNDFYSGSSGVEEYKAEADIDATAPRSSSSYSKTNVQEAGVDESDYIKTNGQFVFWVSNGNVEVTSVGANKLQRLTTIKINTEYGTAKQLLLTDRKLYVLADRYTSINDPTKQSGGITPFIGGSNDSSIVSYDIADPKNPVFIEAIKAKGSIELMRLSNEKLIASVQFDPRLIIDSKPRSRSATTDFISKMKIDDWLPTASLITNTGSSESKPLVECSNVGRVLGTKGIATSTVIQVETSGSLHDFDSAAIVGVGLVSYSTSDSFYIASPGINNGFSTIHKFKLNKGIQYVGSGDVDGAIDSSYQLSEKDELLRVATTLNDGASSYGGAVYTLEGRDDKLEVIGQLSGLGRDNREAVKGVRFIGNKGYVITYRNTDPLHVVDFSNPRELKELGELKIPGYSGYLHGLPDNRLLGVGYEGNNLVFYLFGVSDDLNPKLLHSSGYTNAYSDVTQGTLQAAHSFLYWPEKNLVFAPVQVGGISSVKILQPKADVVYAWGEIEPCCTESYKSEMVLRTIYIDDKVVAMRYGGLQLYDIDTKKTIDSLSVR